MISPSEIDLKSLPWLPLDAKTAFPKNPAIYFAIDSTGKVQYIGRSVNPKTRWHNHHRYEELAEIGNIRIAYLFVDLPDLLPQIEAALIEWFDPPLNIVGKHPVIEETSMVVATSKPKMSVYLDPELLKWFQQYCKQQKRSGSSQVSFMIEQLKKQEEKKDNA